MSIQNAQDLFVTVLSDLHQREQKALQFWQEMSRQAQNEEIKEILDTRAHLTRQSISNLEECFKILGKQPVTTSGRVHDVVVENFRETLDEIQEPRLKGLYVLHAIREVVQFHISEYVTLATMAEVMGNIPVSALLESNLAEKMVFVERVRTLLRTMAEAVITAKMRKAA